MLCRRKSTNSGEIYSLKKRREWFICDAKSGFSGNEVWGIGLAK